VRLEELGQLKKKHLIGTRTHDLPACSIVPQPTTPPRVPYHNTQYRETCDVEDVCLNKENLYIHACMCVCVCLCVYMCMCRLLLTRFEVN
jgi:hypothetical protein